MRAEKKLAIRGIFPIFRVRPGVEYDITPRVMDDAAILDLPDDPAALKAIIAGRDAAIAERDMALFGRHKQIEAMERAAAGALAGHDAQIAKIKREADAALEQIKREAAEQLEAERRRHKASSTPCSGGSTGRTPNASIPRNSCCLG
jgi:hypothetical protein